MSITDGLAEIDREYPLDGRPVVNLIAMAHGGSRSVAAHLDAAGHHVRRIHLQRHWHDVAWCAKLVQSPDLVLAVRDPILVALSTMARDDDSLEAVIDNACKFFALDWTAAQQVIPVELTPNLPLIGALDYPDKAAYLAGDFAAIWSRHPALYAALSILETACRAKMSALGYSLPWWS